MADRTETTLTNRQIELLIWKTLVDEGGAMTVPYVEDKPERRVRYIRHQHYVECVAEGVTDNQDDAAPVRGTEIDRKWRSSIDDRAPMSLKDFQIGVYFWFGGLLYRCTDIGTRVAVAINIDMIDIDFPGPMRSRRPEEEEGPPYVGGELVINEQEIPECRKAGEYQ